MKLSLVTVNLQRPIGRLDPQAADFVRWFLFEFIRGANAEHHRRWVRMWARVWNRGGELAAYPVVEQSSKVRAWYMAMEGRLFASQEPFYNRDGLRDWIKTGAHFGRYEATAVGLVFVPNSLSPEECSDDEIREFVPNAKAFLRTDHALERLWPHVDAARRAEALELVLEPPQEHAHDSAEGEP